LTVDELQSSSIGNAQRTEVPPDCVGGRICLLGGRPSGWPRSALHRPKIQLSYA